MISDHKVTVTGGTVFGVDQAGGRGEWSAGQLIEAGKDYTVLVQSITPFPENTMERTINELAIAAKMDEVLGNPPTALDGLARAMSLHVLLKDMTDEEVSGFADEDPSPEFIINLTAQDRS